MDTSRFYQILGYRGHFKAEYWQWEPGANKPDHFHEFAHEKPAAEAIAGTNSTLYVDAPVDAAGTSTARSLELNLGIRPWGAMSLLIDKETFRQHVWPAAGIRGPTKKLPPAYPTSNYLSISPIKFRTQDELLEFFKSVRTKNSNKYGQDDSKLNNNYSERTPNRGRAEFEQARLLYHGWYGGRHQLLPFYGLPQLSPHLRFAYLAFTPWIDPNSYNILPNEEEPVLDIGWYEAGSGTTHHVVIDEYDTMNKRSLPKANFTHGESTTLPESSIPSTLSSLLTSETSPGPLILVTYDWPRTARLLKTHGIDTSKDSWHVGLSELLGFERPNARNGAGNRREREGNNYEHRPQYRHRDLDNPPNEIKSKFEPKEESKPYGGRWGASSPIRKRSLSPRSRTRPLEDQTDRKYQRPLFDADDDKEEGELSSPPPPDPITTQTQTSTNSNQPDIYVIDIRHLFSIVLNTPEPRGFITYPPCARRLGFEVDGWCAGNQAVQMHTILESLVGGEPIHRRQAELKSQPGLPNPFLASSTEIPIILEGKAGETEPKRPIRPDYQSDGEVDDDDDW